MADNQAVDDTVTEASHESDGTQMSQTQSQTRMTDMTDSQIFETPDFDLVIGGGGQLPQSSMTKRKSVSH